MPFSFERTVLITEYGVALSFLFLSVMGVGLVFFCICDFGCDCGSRVPGTAAEEFVVMRCRRSCAIYGVLCSRRLLSMRCAWWVGCCVQVRYVLDLIVSPILILRMTIQAQVLCMSTLHCSGGDDDDDDDDALVITIVCGRSRSYKRFRSH